MCIRDSYRTSIRTRSSKSTRRLNMSRLSFALVLLVPRCSRRSISSRVPTYSRPVRQRTRFCRTRRKCTCGTARVSWMKSRRRWRRGGLDSFLRMRSIFLAPPKKTMAMRVRRSRRFDLLRRHPRLRSMTTPKRRTFCFRLLARLRVEASLRKHF